MSRVLITGAGGFLGAVLLEDLRITGYQVRALVRTGSSLLNKAKEDMIVGDIRDAGCVRNAIAGCDSIIHLAGKVHAIDDKAVPEDEYRSINVEGTNQLLKGAKTGGVQKFVFASTVKVFGETTVGCVDETAPAAPQSAYARSKWSAEQLVAASASATLATVSFRLPLVYGPTEKGNLFRMIAAIDRRRFPPLPRGTTMRSMLHVKNFVAAVRAALDTKAFAKPMYVITDAAPYSVSEIYDRLREGLGRRPALIRIPAWALSAGARCGDVLENLIQKPFPLSSTTLKKLLGQAWYSPAAAIRDLHYQPSYTFESAVPALIDHYRRSI